MRRTERHELARLRARVDVEDRLRRALTGVDDEDEARDLIESALRERFDHAVHVVLPDPVTLRLGSAAIAGQHLGDHPSALAAACKAIRRGITAVAASGARFDACEHLRASTPPASGVCVPVAAGGRVIGALQWTGTEGRPLDESGVAELEALAQLFAVSVLLVRIDAADPPRIDPLTGLLNPYSTDRAIRDLVNGLVPFSLAVCTIDDLDAYNEHHGHEAGDHALRMFAHALTATVRPDDVVGRTDIDRFTVVFPSTSALDAAQALERVRERLVLSQSDATVPAFRAAFGVADSNQGGSIEEIVQTAERATAMARRAGSNRVVVAGEETTPDLDDRDR